MCYTYTTEYDSVVKKNRMMLFAARRMCTETVTPSEAGQRGKNITSVCNLF